VSASKIFIKLMERLNYTKYIIQGGDWGGISAMVIASKDPEHCEALHLNFAPIMIFGNGFISNVKGILTYLFPTYFLTELELFYLNRFAKDLIKMTGYFHLQSTKPQTIGYSLNDSPVGLAAYILEKFHYWSENIENRLTKDEILNNIMMYWVTGTITSSMRLYYETYENMNEIRELPYISQPVAFIAFPSEIIITPKSWMQYKLNVVRYSYSTTGGHFAALEEPEELTSDLIDFISELDPKRNEEL